MVTPSDTNFNIFELRGDDVLRTVRVATASGAMDDLRFMAGRKVEIQGIFFDLEQVMDPQQHPVLRYFPGAIRQDGMSFDKNFFIAVTSVDVIEEVKSDIGPDKEIEEADVTDPDIDSSDSRRPRFAGAGEGSHAAPRKAGGGSR